MTILSQKRGFYRGKMGHKVCGNQSDRFLVPPTHGMAPTASSPISNLLLPPVYDQRFILGITDITSQQSTPLAHLKGTLEREIRDLSNYEHRMAPTFDFSSYIT